MRTCFLLPRSAASAGLASIGLLLWLALVLGGCDFLNEDDVFEREFVVESYQVALRPLAPVLISRTAAIDEPWVFGELSVGGADVKMHLLREDGSVEATFPYRASRERGVYFVEDRDHRVLPLRTYALDITPPDGDPISARTLVPDTFRVVNTNADTLVYQGTDQLEIRVTRSFYPGRQNVFIFVSEALEPSFATLTPFAAAIFNEDEDDLEDFATGASPILNEGNYDLNADGTLTINLPWLAVTFYGPNRLIANALDDNLLDFLRSQFVQENGSTLSPGEIPDVISNVEGARGVFGSYATSVAEAFIARQ